MSLNFERSGRDCFLFEDLKPDCDCPHEHWHVLHHCLDIHFEPDGSAHVLLIGEDEWDFFVNPGATMDQARSAAFSWAEDMFAKGDS